MMFAAAALGVAAALRPGELLGSPKLTDRALTLGQLAFYANERALLQERQPMAPAPGAATPTILELTLKATKTQQHQSTTKIVSASAAVAAVWRWCLVRGASSPAAILFADRADVPLTTSDLCHDLMRRHRRAGLGEVFYSGKCMRRGGASTLAVQGIDDADIAALGWAPDSKMWERYAGDPAVQRARAVARASLMQPTRVSESRRK
jgi:hypothetical protein